MATYNYIYFKGLSTGAIVGIAVGSVAIVILIVISMVISVAMIRKKRYVCDCYFVLCIF